MATPDTASAQTVSDLRQRYVSGAVATPPIVAARAEGARIVDADGTSFIDFAGGLGCLNVGHNAPEVVAAIHAQADRYLHQCFMVAMYEPYVEVCRRLADLSPCRGEEQKSLLLNSGAEAVENAVKVARAFTGRRGVVAFDRAFHGRTNLTMAMTSKVKPYKHGFGPLATEVYRAPAPYPYRGVTTDDAIAGLEALFRNDCAPEDIACLVLEPVQGEGGFIPMPADFLWRLREICDEHGIVFVDDEVQAGMGRTGPVWAIEHVEGLEPDVLVSGKSLGGGLPLAAITARAEIMDAPEKGGLGGTFGGNPLSCAAAIAALDIVASPAFRERTERLGERLRAGLDEIAGRHDFVGEVRGLGPMLALELDTRERAFGTTQAARERGLILLSCGYDGQRRARARPARHRRRRPRRGPADPRRRAGRGLGLRDGLARGDGRDLDRDAVEHGVARQRRRAACSSASRFEFTPACSRATRQPHAVGVVAPAVRDRDDAGHDRVGHLDGHLDLAGARARRARARRRRGRGASASSGCSHAVQRSLPFTSGGRLCIQELFERSWRRPISTIPPSAGAPSAACRRGDVGDDRLGRELDLAARRAQRVGQARLSGPRSMPCGAASRSSSVQVVRAGCAAGCRAAAPGRAAARGVAGLDAGAAARPSAATKASIAASRRPGPGR